MIIAELKTNENESINFPDRFEIKEIATIKDIEDKDVQVYKSLGSYTIAEIEDTLARLDKERAMWQARLDEINKIKPEVVEPTK